MRVNSPSFFLSVLPILFTVGLLIVQIVIFDSFTPHIPLLLGVAVTGCVGATLAIPWRDLEKGMLKVVSVALPSIAILFMVGCIIALWIASGTVPTLIYYGLKVLSPEWFLAAAMVLCAVVSVSLGTSWGTTATIGLALMGIGEGFGIPMYWTAGAVVSGAFFGDKISPLSDTTNLAPAVTDTHVFDHIKNMMPTTVPAFILALISYLCAGFFIIDTSHVSFEKIMLFTHSLSEDFVIHLGLLSPAVLVLVLALKRYQPLPCLFAGALSGAVLAIGIQGHSIKSLFAFAFSGFVYETPVQELDTLLNRGGVQSMSWVVLLMLTALAFGGALEKIGAMTTILSKLRRVVRTFAGLQVAATLSAVCMNLVAGDPYLAITLPGRMFKDAYDELGYDRLNLARSIEEGGTLVSPLVPWNAGGAFVITALGLGIFDGQFINLLYIPLAILCWASPLIGMVYAGFGIFSLKADLTHKEMLS